jgi:diacylglycerol kinase (ATP)
MKRAHILHNPNAGSQDQSKNDLIKLIESHGYECGYSSTKEVKWKKVDPKTDFLVVAGGDGTVRTVAVDLFGGGRFIEKRKVQKTPADPAASDGHGE